MATIDTNVADKDQLIEFAKAEYKIIIDPRTKIETIRLRVQGLIEGVTPEIIEQDVAAPVVGAGRYVLSLINGHVYEWHEYLVGADFTACNADGVIV